MKKLLFVFGTRPEAIKMLPIIAMAKQHFNHIFATQVCVTAQHRHMLDQVLQIFNINPDFDLNIMSANQSLTDITSKILINLTTILQQNPPDCLLVHGDTTTTFASALAAFYQLIPVAHIEAGLRTKNIYNPWPEEANRTLTGHIAKYHFAPTEHSKNNLTNEAITEHVVVTGNSVIDALNWITDKLQKDSALAQEINNMLINYNIDFNKKIILVTGHRRENFGDGLMNICYAIKKIAEQHPDIQIVYPVHLNNNVQEPVNRALQNTSNIILLKPLDYASFIYLMQKSYIILTDSGGIQEEAISLKKPILVMRTFTERTEGILSGNARLVGTTVETICQAVALLLNDQHSYHKMSTCDNPYGNGNTAKIILDYLSCHL